MNNKNNNVGKIDEWIVYLLIVAACLNIEFTFRVLANGVYLLSAGLAGIYLIWKLVINKKLFQSKYNICAFVLSFTVVLSVLINKSFFLLRNIRCIIGCILIYFIIFQIGEHKDKKTLNRIMHNCNLIFILFTLVYGIISLVFLFFKREINFTDLLGNKIFFGWYSFRVVGIYGNSAVEGIMSTISFSVGLFDLSLIEKEKNKKYYKIIILNEVIQSIAVLLSACRTAIIAYAIVVIIYYIYSQLIKNTNIFKIFIKSGIVFVSLVMVLIVCGEVLYKLPTLYNGIVTDNRIDGSISISDRFTTGTQIPNDIEDSNAQNDKNKLRIFEVLDKYSSGRIEIWKQGILSLKNHVLFGLGPYMVNRGDEEEIIHSQLSFSYISMHNDFCNL